jgi:serine/threonine protein kinase
VELGLDLARAHTASRCGDEGESAMSSAQIPTTAFPRLGRYQIERKLGEGGMGAVYLAVDTHLNRQVAVKILPPHSVNNPDAVVRFCREARALAQLSHPNIIQAHDAGEEDGQHFLVMEYVEGKSLAAVLDEKGPLPPARAAAYVHQAALALAHAHDKGLIHRDIKPSNLLVTADGQVKLLDLGLARFMQDQLGDTNKTREGVGMGTPDYAPPEQFRDAHNVDRRADVYSLGCTLYHLLTGRVPFPGTSLSDKYTAHAERQPAPLTEFGVEAPAGLVLALEKMMAKRPGERFQSAREVADALMPHVSASSSSFAQFKSTASWHMGQLEMPEFPRRRRLVPWAVAGVATVAALVLFGVALKQMLRPESQPLAQTDPGDGKKPDDRNTDDDKKRDSKTGDDTKPGAAVEGDPNILTVSIDKKDGGQYRSIGDALSEVQPGQTIRVLDDGPYQENLLINRPSRQRRIRLESSRKALLELSSERQLLIIDGVPGVTLSHFRLRIAKNLPRPPGGVAPTLVVVRNTTPGVTLERLTLEGRGDLMEIGINVLVTDREGEAKRPPVVIRDCLLRRVGSGILVNGTDEGDYHKAVSVSSVVVRDNLLEGCNVAVRIVGKVRYIQVVGNRVAGSMSGCQLENLLDGAGPILVANNTLFENNIGLRSWDGKLRGDNVQVRNNLILASKNFDMLAMNNEGRPDRAEKPGDGSKAPEAWQCSYNWREGRKPPADDPWGPGWMSPGAKDVVRDEIVSVERVSSSPLFLRPKKDSPLTTAGAGEEEPSLPSYVGALPPEGGVPWDWERTWLAWPGTTKLLTVAKNEMIQAKYHKIDDALKEAKQWDTVRVLDDATYEETVDFTDEDRQTGLCLEAVNGATIRLPNESGLAVQIRGVPHVRLTGFRLTQARDRSAPIQTLVQISGRTPGVTLDGLRFEPRDPSYCVSVENGGGAPGEPPLVIRRCRFRSQPAAAAIGVLVSREAGAAPRQGIRIVENEMTGMLEAVTLKRELLDVQVVGNRIFRSPQSAVKLQDLQPGARDILIANNTVIEGFVLLTVIDNKPYPAHVPGQVETANNIFLGADASDWSFVETLDRIPGTKNQNQVQAGDAEALVKKWRFHHNWRDHSGRERTVAIPTAPQDREYDASDLLSIDVSKADQIRPRKDSAPAKEGAGRVDPSLPTYLGALPPEGNEAWNWDWTWHARAPRALPEKK